MATKKKETVEAVEETKAPKAKKAPAKKAEKVEKKEDKKKVFSAPVAADYKIILAPVITEKSMALLQNSNKVTVKVAAKANKTAIKESFQRLYQVSVDDVKIVNVLAKSTTRGGRYQGHISGYKNAIITIHEGAAIDPAKE